MQHKDYFVDSLNVRSVTFEILTGICFQNLNSFYTVQASSQIISELSFHISIGHHITVCPGIFCVYVYVLISRLNIY
jgi:hypothetical protein